mmetsp:Transcript_42439/g.65116  ORF Transcript_42439/g.65116 Transcript_42439/m.65116 type:complete len:147 (+) Transcript_42439:2601-3041(+)
MVFLVFYYIDLLSLDEAEGYRHKGLKFILCKSVCFFVQTLFFVYELVQMYLDGSDYFTDSWNYLELLGNFLYGWGAVLDIINPQVTDTTRILISVSVAMTLAKIVYLIRVFRQLNFLVTMLMTVINEIFFFMILFAIFIVTFAQSF